MSYENEQRRLLALFEQVSTSDNEHASSDEERFDHISQRSQDSDTEQEGSDSDERETIITTSDQQFFTGKDNITKWSSQPPRSNVRKRSENIILQKHGVNPFAQNSKTEIECWKHFISTRMLQQILCFTNAKIKQRQFANNDKSRKYFLKEATMEELLALLGLMYLAGLNHSNRQNLSDLWRSDGTGVDIFRTTMSMQRFYFLQSCLRFDDALTRQERKSLDNLAPIRSIFEDFVSNCKYTYTPSKYLTIDEKLEAFRGRCSFRQYIPNKPAKYGIKMYALVDVKNFYTVNLEIYPGKQPDGPFLQSNKAFDVVDRLVQPISKSNRNITFDNWFTSVPLMTHLQKNHKLTSTGTLRKNKKEIPPRFITTRGKEIYSTQFAFQKDITLVSYIPKKSKVMLVLSSLHHDQNIDPTSGDKCKPEILTFYNSTKIGVDVVDELCAAYDVSRNSKRWPMTVFYAIMNVAAINSVIIYRENNNSQINRSDFLRKLGLSMLEGHLCVRKNMENLPRGLRKRIHDQFGETMTYAPSKSSTTYRRCKVCPSAKDRKTKHNCNKCNKPICMQHIIPLCQSCVDLDSD
ncbi:unnamed protein product [Euphydryas editha]|uniref:PiggyBac transposable element-derived protein domain-containing protein n=1 Tax=Euphydryas editha TaxID=104508 RepID=A0AAU9TFT2_EUPED|nr:unnamed protein product [Euphydryas editha]